MTFRSMENPTATPPLRGIYPRVLPYSVISSDFGACHVHDALQRCRNSAKKSTEWRVNAQKKGVSELLKNNDDVQRRQKLG